MSCPLSAQVALNAANFPDNAFRAALADKFSISEGDVITADQISATDAIIFKNLGINDLTGIAFFTELVELQVSQNQLTGLDLSQNTQLQLLACWGNQLTQLDVSSLPELYYLDIEGNNISQIDLSRNQELALLFISENPIETLDLAEVAALEGINGYSCNFIHLDMSNNPEVSELYLEDNNLNEGEMDALISSLPDRSGKSAAGKISVFDSWGGDKNVCNTNTVAKAKAKNWDVLYWDDDSGDYADYEGTAPTGIKTIDAGNADTGNTRSYNLGGQRVGNAYKGIVIINGKKHIMR